MIRLSAFSATFVQFKAFNSEKCPQNISEKQPLEIWSYCDNSAIDFHFANISYVDALSLGGP